MYRMIRIKRFLVLVMALLIGILAATAQARVAYPTETLENGRQESELDSLSQAKKPKKHNVTVAGGPAYLFRFQPSELEIHAGDKVKFSNPSSVDHQVHPYGMEWARVDAHLTLSANGGKATYRFKTPGVYEYRCDIQFHSDMVGDVCLGLCGTITVKSTNAPHSGHLDVRQQEGKKSHQDHYGTSD